MWILLKASTEDIYRTICGKDRPIVHDPLYSPKNLTYFRPVFLSSVWLLKCQIAKLSNFVHHNILTLQFVLQSRIINPPAPTMAISCKQYSASTVFYGLNFAKTVGESYLITELFVQCKYHKMAPVTQDIMVAPASKVHKHKNKQINKQTNKQSESLGKTCEPACSGRFMRKSAQSFSGPSNTATTRTQILYCKVCEMLCTHPM